MILFISKVVSNIVKIGEDGAQLAAQEEIMLNFGSKSTVCGSSSNFFLR
jgi:hypothetical protein